MKPHQGPDLVAAAEKLATLAHSGQIRRDGKTSYIWHPRAVAARLIMDCASCTAIAAAWLHDVLEDTNETPESLRDAGISDEVVQVVELLTKTEGASYWAYLDAIMLNPIARQVKIADMLSNLADSPTEKQIIKYSRGLLHLHGEK